MSGRSRGQPSRSRTGPGLSLRSGSLVRHARGAGGLVVLAFAVVLIAPCAAEEPAGERLTLAALLELARAQNREIRAAESRYQAMRQRPIQERTLPDPSLSIRYHNEELDRVTLGESEFSFVEIAAEQEVPFPGKLALRGRMAEREAEREGAMRDLAVLMVLAKAAASFADLGVVDRSIAIIQQSLAAFELIVEQARASYDVGTTAQQDVLRAGLERDALKERLTMLEQKRAAGAATINALLTRRADHPIPPVEWQDQVAALPPLEDLGALLRAQAPELCAAQEEILKSQDAVALARREYFPDVAFMAAYTNKSDLLPEWEVGMEVKVPLYFWRRQRPAVAEAVYAARAAEATRENAQATLEGQLRGLHAMAEAALRLIRLYTDALIPQAELTLESARASYAVGKVDFLTTSNAFTALLEYRMRYAEQVGSLARARAEIGPLVGRTPLAW